MNADERRGRPPGSGRGIGDIPRGIEVLVKKAAVDAAFRTALVETRSKAAGLIGLRLLGTESAMLDVVPRAQLEAIIARTTVEPRHLAAFLGRAAAAMLIALGVSTTGGCIFFSYGCTMELPPEAQKKHDADAEGRIRLDGPPPEEPKTTP